MIAQVGLLEECPVHRRPVEIDRCAKCNAKYCDACTRFDRSVSLCSVCFERRETRRTWTVRGAWALGIVVVLGGGCWAIRVPMHRQGLQGAVAEKQEEDRLDKLRAAVTKEPCDRSKIIELGDGLMMAGEPREALERANTFLGKCGDYPRLLWITYAAHQRLGEWPAAIADASKLIESEPDAKDYWWWRGIIEEKHGSLEDAARDYRQAIAIEPALSAIPINLADVYEKLNRPCDAIQPLEQLAQHHAKPDPRLDARIRRLSDLPACKALAGTGTALIRYKPGASIIGTTAKVNDVSAKLVVDTGASYVALGPALAKKAKIDGSGWPEVTFISATGPHKVRIGTVDSITVAGVHAEHVEVALLPSELPEIDGLLGLSFLSRFSMQLEPSKGELKLGPR